LNTSSAIGGEKSAAFPLTIWGWVALVGLLQYFLLSKYLLGETPPSAEFERYNTARLKEFAEETRAGATGVVLIGDSRLRYSTVFANDLSDRLSALTGSPVSVLRLVNDSAIIEDFLPLASAIFDANPRLIVIQKELTARHRTANRNNKKRGRDYILWRLVGDGAWNPDDVDYEHVQTDQRCEFVSAEDAQTRRNRLSRWMNYDQHEYKTRLALDFRDRARARGIDVRFLAVPVTSEAASTLVEPGPNPELELLMPSVDIPDSEFCDPVHMNPAGRQRYSSWLAETLAGLLQSAKR